MSHMMTYSFLPEFGFAVPLDDLLPSPLYGEDRPVRRDRPLGEILGLAGLTKLSTDGRGGEFRTLDEVTLSIRRGEILGLIGPDGAATTALLRSLNLLERPTAGEIIFEGEVVQDRDGEGLAALRRKIGVVFRAYNLLASRRLFDNVALPMRLARRRAWEIANRVPVLLELVGLGDKQDAFPDQLSCDEKRRLGIARALALQPEILLCEEPTSFLAPDAAHRVLELLKDVNRQTGVTIVLTTDDMSVIRTICDRLAVMEAGRVVEEGPVWESFAHPRTPLTRRLLHGLLPELPPFIRARIRPEPEGPSDAILRLKFGGSSAYDPVIAEFAREADAVFSVIHGAIDYIQEQPLGVLFLSLQAKGPEHLRSLIAYLRSRVLDVEVIGYVPRSA
jgi:D-methionine transport system ATP-binding protein